MSTSRSSRWQNKQLYRCQGATQTLAAPLEPLEPRVWPVVELNSCVPWTPTADMDFAAMEPMSDCRTFGKTMVALPHDRMPAIEAARARKAAHLFTSRRCQTTWATPS